MTNEEILNKAIEKALANGLKWKDGRDEIELMFENPYEFIFSHDFAKAFFSSKTCGCVWCRGEFSPGVQPDSDHNDFLARDWKTHLKAMVLKKEPLKYLEKFLDEKDK